MRHIALAVVLLSSPLALVACESGPSSASGASSLASMSPSELMSGYTSKLGDLGNLLKGVNSQQSAAAALPKATDLAKSLSGYVEQISGLPTAQYSALIDQYRPQIEPATKVLDEQIARLAQNPTYGSALTQALQGLPRL